MKEIGKGALNTSSHNDIEYEGTLKDWCSISFGADWRVMIDNVSLIIGGERIEKLLLEGTGAIPDYAFLGFDIGSVTLGDGVKKIGKSAFCYCKSLASLSLGDSVEEIGERAFNMCTSLAELSLGTGLGNIGKYAFAYCENLSCTVRLPASLTEIGYAPFTETPITAFEVEEGNLAYSAQDGVLFDKEMKILVAYPRGKSDETYTVPDGVNRIAAEAFYTNPYLCEVAFPASLEEIGNSAFYSCSALEKITFAGNSLVSVGSDAFYRTGLLAAELPDSVKYVSRRAFNGCSQMEYIILGKGIEQIDTAAFGNMGTDFKLFYRGSEAEWNEVKKVGGISCDVYFYSETEPTGAGNYWHYVDGKPEIWGT